MIIDTAELYTLNTNWMTLTFTQSQGYEKAGICAIILLQSGLK